MTKRHFTMKQIEHLKGPSLEKESQFLLTEVLRQKLLDEPSSSKLKSTEHTAQEKALQFQQKLDELSQRLQKGFQLIKDKIRGKKH